MLPVTARLFRAANTKMEVLRAHALEPVTGIEPAFPAWNAGVLPLNHTGIVPVFPGCQSSKFSISAFARS